MKAALIITGSGPLVILTSYASLWEERFLEKMEAKGITKFIAYELPIEEVKRKYGQHFNVVVEDLQESSDLRVLDYNGQRAIALFRLSELGSPIVVEPEKSE